MARPRFLLFLVFATLFASSFLLAPAFAQVDDDEDDTPEFIPTSEGSGANTASATDVVSTSAEEEEEEVKEIKLRPAAGVETTALFPAFFGKEPVIHAGQEVELLFSINNGASSPLYLTNATGVLFLPYDFKYVAQNFTGNSYNATLAPGVQSSFSFTFKPDRMLQARDFGLAVVAFYTLEGAPHASALFNATFELLEPTGYVSGESIFLLTLALGLLALGGMWVQAQLETMSKKSRRTKKVETGTGGDSETEENEWLQGTFFKQPKKTKSQQAAKPRKKRA